MIAVFELEFESDDMWDEESLVKEMGGDWLKAMQWLYKNDGLGIFNEEPTLINVKPKSTEKTNG